MRTPRRALEFGTLPVSPAKCAPRSAVGSAPFVCLLPDNCGPSETAVPQPPAPCNRRPGFKTHKPFVPSSSSTLSRSSMSNDISFPAQFGVIWGAEAPVSHEGALGWGLEWKRCAARCCSAVAAPCHVQCLTLHSQLCSLPQPQLYLAGQWLPWSSDSLDSKSRGAGPLKLSLWQKLLIPAALF